MLYKTAEQWHWFDCPRQLGTNSPDTPDSQAKTEVVELQEGDVVLAISDGVSDNLWEHEVVENIVNSLHQEDEVLKGPQASKSDGFEAMRRVAGGLVKAAKVIAEDPFAESPFMERAVEEGLPMEGGTLSFHGLTYHEPYG